MSINQLPKEKIMGFFEDTKPPEPKPVVQEVKQDWLAVLIGGAFALLGIILVHALKSIAFVARPTFAYLFTFEGRTRQQITQQMMIAALIVGVPLFFLYRVPFIRDGLTLSGGHTINHTANGQRIAFPDRSVFVPTERRMGGVYAGKTYITYSGYTDSVMQKMETGQCQLVPRGKKMGLASLHAPVQAEGFEAKVSYEADISLPNLPWWKYVSYVLAHPKILFADKESQRGVLVRQETEATWKEFVDNWSTVYSPPGFNGFRVYTVRALPNEHAIVCF